MSGGRKSLSRTAFELRRIWEGKPPGCALCQFIARGTEQYVDVLFYENVNDSPTREAIRQARGFCRYHARFVARQADALGTAIILNDVLTNDLRALDRGEYDRPSAAPNPLIGRLFDRPAEDRVQQEILCPPCPICQDERGREDSAVDSLLEGLADAEFSRVFARSAGLCMPHFRLAFSRADDSGQWVMVLDTQKRALGELTAQLGELARKHDYRFRDEPMGEEMRSWRRALNATSAWVED